ncbi:MAG TPA: PAS domain S-box protein, partial [Gallionella sp.]|nr:PAS domain S-box protein [Gallionella sp.]
MQDTSTRLDANLLYPLPAEDKLGWTKTAALLSTTLGLVVLCGWTWNIEALQHLLPGMVSMKANTAAAFVLSGISLYLHTLRKISPTALMIRRLGAFLVLLLGLATLSEYFFDWGAGIDQLLFKEPVGAILTSHPGRMSNITAINFALTGGALLLLEARLWMAVQAAASAVAAVTLISLFGYMIGNLLFLRIGIATSIAAHTVVGFLMLAAGVLITTQNHGFMLRLRGKSQVIGLAASLFMLASIFCAASYNLAQKDNASQWVKHTYEVILGIKSFSASIHDFLYHNRGYLISGDERQLTARDKSRDVMLVELARVHEMASDNPVQHERLVMLDNLVQQRVTLADLAVRLRREKSAEAAISMLLSGKNNALTDEIEAKLDELENTEKDLLKEQQRIAEVMRSSNLFTLGVLLGAALLALLWIFRSKQREITERKRAEDLLRISYEEIEDLYNHAPCGYHSLDNDGVICRINDTELAWLGYTRDEVVEKRKWPDLITNASQQYFRENFPLLKKQGFIHDVEIEIIRKDGSIFIGLLNATAIYDLSGHYVMSRSTLFDITERKQAEEVLKLHKLVIDTAMDGFWMVDRAGNLRGANEAYARMSGYAVAELLNMHISQLEVKEKSAEEVAAHIKKIIAMGSEKFETRHCRKDGQEIDVEISTRFMPESQSFCSFLRDITERKRVERELRELNEHLEERVAQRTQELTQAKQLAESANRIKSEFLANMSHEI